MIVHRREFPLFIFVPTLLSLISLPSFSASELEHQNVKPAKVNPPVSRQAEESFFEKIEQHLELTQVNEADFQELAAFLQQHPHHSVALFLLRKCYAQLGLEGMEGEQVEKAERSFDPQMVLQLFKRHIENYDLRQAFSLLPTMMKVFPGDPSVQLVDAIFLEETGHKQEAVLKYEQLLRLPEPPPGVASRMALIKFDEKDYTKTLTLTDIDLARNHNFLPALLAKAMALSKLGRNNEALTILQAGLEKHPFDKRLTLVAHEASLANQDLIGALKYGLLHLAVSDFSSHKARRRVRDTLTRLSLSQADPVIAAVSSIIDKTPHAMKFHYCMGEIFVKLNRQAPALEQFLLSRRLDPYYEPTNFQLGHLSEIQDCNYATAQAFYELASKTKPLYLENNVHKWRLRRRLDNQKRDVAWRMKDAMFHLACGPEGKLDVLGRVGDVRPPQRAPNQSHEH